MPNWVKKSKDGLLTCILCASLVVQVGFVFICQNESCEKHSDEPMKQFTLGVYSPTQVVIGTASTSPSLSISPSASPSEEFMG